MSVVIFRSRERDRRHTEPGDNKACRDWKVVNSAPSMITGTRFPGALNDTPSLTRATREKPSQRRSREIRISKQGMKRPIVFP